MDFGPAASSAPATEPCQSESHRVSSWHEIQSVWPNAEGIAMALNLFNTLTRSVQEFVPLDPAGRKVGMYCCGPTIYDFGPIGNFRTFAFGDLVRRYLEFR